MRPHIHKLLDQIGIPKFLEEWAERADLNNINLPTNCRIRVGDQTIGMRIFHFGLDQKIPGDKPWDLFKSGDFYPWNWGFF